jgi:hypothetical protein
MPAPLSSTITARAGAIKAYAPRSGGELGALRADSRPLAPTRAGSPAISPIDASIGVPSHAF